MQPDSTAAGRRAATGVRSRSWTRRELLRTAGTAGLGGAVGIGLATARLSANARTEIVFAVARRDAAGGPLRPRTKTVPTPWYETVQRAFDVLAELRALDLPTLVASFAVLGGSDEPAASIAVEATDDGVRDPIQDLSGGLPVDLAIVEELPPAPDRQPDPAAPYEVPDLDRRAVPSGYACAGTDSTGTIAPALYDETGRSPWFTTSNHLYGAAGTKETDHEGQPLSLSRGADRRRIGRVVRGYPRADVVQVAPIDGYRSRSAIARTSPGTVVGQYTRAGLADLMARGEPLRKVGAFSNRTAGEIKGIDGQTCYVGEVCKPGQLKWGDEGTMVDGDSGSVSYHPDPDRPDEAVLIAGINNARTWWPGMDFTWGTAAHHLHSEYGFHF